MPHLVKLLDKQRTIIKTLNDVTAPSYNRKICAVSPFSIELDGCVETDATIARYIQLCALDKGKKQSEVLVTGVITRCEWDGDCLNVTASTEEALLKRIITPAQYGLNYSSQTLKQAIESLCKGCYYPKRIKTYQEWLDNATFDNTIAVQQDNGLVQLEQNGLTFEEEGNVVICCDSSEIPKFICWERIRWVGSWTDTVAVAMQYQFTSTPNSPPSSGWIPTNLENFGSGSVVGAASVDSDTIGFALPDDSDDQFLCIRFNLKTNDTTTPDDESNPTQVGFTPFLHVVEVIARTEADFTCKALLDDIDAVITAVDANNKTFFEVIKSLTEQTGYEFMMNDGVLCVEEEFGSDKTNDIIFTTGSVKVEVC